MDKSLEELVWKRAGGHCEYCRFPSEYAAAPFQIDHIRARKHGGASTPENLALSCFFCNSHKGPNIAGIDPVSGRLVRLCNPRQDGWNSHFAWDGPILTGQSAIGRVTIHVLWMNHPLRVETRRWLIAAGTL